MQKLFLLFVILVIGASGLFVGCGSDPGMMIPATTEETENDPALKDKAGA
jgi:hypothetical protein